MGLTRVPFSFLTLFLARRARLFLILRNDYFLAARARLVIHNSPQSHIFISSFFLGGDNQKMNLSKKDKISVFTSSKKIDNAISCKISGKLRKVPHKFANVGFFLYLCGVNRRKQNQHNGKESIRARAARLQYV